MCQFCKPNGLNYCLNGGGEYSPPEDPDWKDHTVDVCTCIVCCPCEATILTFYGCSKVYSAIADGSRARRRTREETVPPLPAKRPHALSPPPANSPASTPNPLVPRLPSRYGRPDRKVILTSQQAAPFFKLSTELREMIYRAVLGDYAIYIVQLRAKKDPEGGHRRNRKHRPRMGCLKTKLVAGRSAVDAEPLWPKDYKDGFDIKDDNFGSTGPDGGLLRLLKTCKRVYAEAIGLLYSSNRFIFMRNRDLIAFRNTILPQRANAITTVHLHYPHSADSHSPRIPSDVLSSFNKLRTLDIDFKPRRDWTAKYSMEWLLGIIPMISDDVTITVVLRWATTCLLDRLDASTKPNLHVVKPPESEIIPSGERWDALRFVN